MSRLIMAVNIVLNIIEKRIVFDRISKIIFVIGRWKILLMKDKIKAKRLEMGLSQYVLGEKIGVRSLAVSKWERGVEEPNSTNRRLLAKFFGITERELMFPDD